MTNKDTALAHRYAVEARIAAETAKLYSKGNESYSESAAESASSAESYSESSSSYASISQQYYDYNVALGQWNVGVYPSDPETRRDGSALQVGDLYKNISDDQVYSYNSDGTWTSMSYDLQITNELYAAGEDLYSKSEGLYESGNELYLQGKDLYSVSLEMYNFSESQSEISITDAGIYENGPLKINNYRQEITYNNRRYYVNPSASIPFETTGTTSTSWSDDKSSFIAVGDTDFREDLASKTGALRIGGLSFITPEMFGAIGDGVTDDRQALQDAIDAANANYLAESGPVNILCGNKYLVSLNPSSTLISGEVAAGRGCLDVKSGIMLFGAGTIILDPTVTGTSSGAMITNWSGAVTDVTIKEISIDGQYGTITGSGISAINIVDSTRLLITQIRATNHSGGGIYVRRSGTTTNTYGSVEAKVTNNFVYNVSVIGIQSERPDGIQIHGNTVDTSGDNSIDCEGNDSTSTGQGVGRQMSIKGNTVRWGKNGIFIESLGDGQVNDNTVLTTGIGIIFNRINTGANDNQCLSNTIRGSGSASAGIRCNNQIAALTIGGNRISGFTYGIFFADRIDRTEILPNQFSAIGTEILHFDKVSSGVSMLRSRIASQFYMGTQTSGVPYPTSPRNCPSNYPNRMASTVTYTDVYFSDLTGVGEVNFVRKTSTLVQNTSWAAYAKYGVVTSGYTSLYGNYGNAGEFLEINGIYYKIYSAESSTTEIMKWDATSAAYISGDCTSDFTSALTVKTHRTEWGTL